MVMDSWEAGMQNWTDDMIQQFRKRRGYDPRPYLPVLTGRVVGSADVSDRFLWDFRRTLADMFADSLTESWPTCSISTAWAFIAKRQAFRWKSSKTRC